MRKLKIYYMIFLKFILITNKLIAILLYKYLYQHLYEKIKIIGDLQNINNL